MKKFFQCTFLIATAFSWPLVSYQSVAHGANESALTIQDAIHMTRIQQSVDGKSWKGGVVAISSSGKSAAMVDWHGDLSCNCNIYDLLVLNLTGKPGSEVVKSVKFKGNPDDQFASPFLEVRFIDDDKSISYIGIDNEGVSQVYVLGISDGRVKQLTHHSSSVRTYAMDQEGRLLAFAAVSPSKSSRKSKLDDDGVFLWDHDLFPMRFPYYSAGPLLWNESGETRQYFMKLPGKSQAKLFFDSRQSRPAIPVDLSDSRAASSPTDTLMDENVLKLVSSLTADPKGRYVLFFPYGLTDHDMHSERYAYYNKPPMNSPYVRRMAAPYGLVDLRTGKIERLMDAPHSPFDINSGGGDPLWAPDGKSVLIYTLLPNDTSSQSMWGEMDIATRQFNRLNIPSGWRPTSWEDQGNTLVLNGKYGHVGIMRRLHGREWGKIVDIGAAAGFDRDWPVATNGRSVIGVKDDLLVPPDLASYDLSSKSMTVLTNLNPQLHGRNYGSTSLLRWKSQCDADASGFLIKPVDYKKGVRYPLVIYLDDGTLGHEGRPFLLDGVQQLSGFAVQMLAAKGFMVLYTREPHMRGIVETPKEGVCISQYIMSAIKQLDDEKLVDTRRVGLSGWSRAGYYLDYILIHSGFEFSAAINIDGGSSEYNDGMRPFTDGELKDIHTPILFEPHGLLSLVHQSKMADRMSALHRPNDILYFAAASHQTTRPQHRLRSLETDIDWWRFWLEGFEDPASNKVPQYKHWEKLCEMQKGETPRKFTSCVEGMTH
jgi:dipeptidyl aminopeptidase/acylaminoacyl peptidase